MNGDCDLEGFVNPVEAVHCCCDLVMVRDWVTRLCCGEGTCLGPGLPSDP